MSETKYIISEKELYELLYANITLSSLEASGVDNWQWYYESFCGLEEWYPEVDFISDDPIEDIARHQLKDYKTID